MPECPAAVPPVARSAATITPCSRRVRAGLVGPKSRTCRQARKGGVRQQESPGPDIHSRSGGLPYGTNVPTGRPDYRVHLAVEASRWGGVRGAISKRGQFIIRDVGMPHEARAGLAEWTFEAACNQADPELFFPVGDGRHTLAQVEQAKAYCAVCRVRTECLSFALSSGVVHGVWGGTTGEEREAAIRSGRSAALGSPHSYRFAVSRPMPRGRYLCVQQALLLAGRVRYLRRPRRCGPRTSSVLRG